METHDSIVVRSDTPPVMPDPSPSPITIDPPPLPNLKDLSIAERNIVRRVYEKQMYIFVSENGTLSNDPCGPCSRTKSRCIRHPTLRKCAICFRGHDVCETWDESVVSAGRRRIHPKRIPLESVKKVGFLECVDLDSCCR
jgi:hypothetical protein